ncbi:7601_t:CDS:2 [Racocetra persica]|uniref:7601_t:CDS:1 n=1 Tax=Racocetra persica TaxID=160502 RepID=A0ACA9PZ80_9GLOM|nr:7601_t:CDS:2 [Racocetra persica]
MSQIYRTNSGRIPNNQQEIFDTLFEDEEEIYSEHKNEEEIYSEDENEEIHFEVFRNFNSKRKRKFKEEIDSIDYRRREMNVFQTTKKVYKKLKGHSDIDKNDSDLQFLFSEYYHVFGKSNPLSQHDHSCVGRILKLKKKIQLKHVKKVVEDDLEGVQVKNDIRFVAGNAGITRAAFKYCKRKCIFILEVLKTTDDVIVLYKPKFNKALNFLLTN